MDKITCPACGADNITISKYCSRCGQALPQQATPSIDETPQQSPLDKGIRTRKLKHTLISGIAIVITYWAVQHFFFAAPAIDKQLTSIASEMNKNCPMMADKETRWDNSVVLPDKVLQYNYTLVNMTKGNVDTIAIRNYIVPLVTNNAKTNPEMKTLREDKVTFKYYYKDKNGAYLFSFTVTPDEYEN